MKRALRLFGCCALSGVAILAVRADDTPLRPAPPAAAAVSLPPQIRVPVPRSPAVPLVAHDAPINITNPTDIPSADAEQIADQTLEIVREKKERPEVDGEILAQEQKAYTDEHDWMVRGYEEQLRKNGLEKASAPETDAYGNPVKKTVDATVTDDSLLPDSSSTVKQPAGALDHPDSDPVPGEKQSSMGSSLAPLSLPALLPPLSSADNPSGLAHDSFGGTPDAVAVEPINPSPALTPTGENSILDVPGLTAAEQGGTPDLNVEDRLPDDSGNQPPSHQDPADFSLRQPQVAPNDIDAFYKKQTASLQPATPPTFQTPPALTLPKAYEEPVRTAKPVVDGLRNHVADPLDFLNR